MATKAGQRHAITPEIRDAIIEAMERLGFGNLELARRLGVDRSTVQRIVRGDVSSTPHLPRIYKVLGIAPDHSVVGVVREKSVGTPLVGHVGAGAMYYPSPSSGPWIGFDTVDPAPGAGPDTYAVRVVGDSMQPAFPESTLLYFERTTTFDSESCLGRLCIVQVRGGPAYVKRLERHHGAWRLVSLNFPPIEDVDVEWAAPVTWVRLK